MEFELIDEKSGDVLNIFRDDNDGYFSISINGELVFVGNDDVWRKLKLYIEGVKNA